jgi:hypothetical protein
MRRWHVIEWHAIGGALLGGMFLVECFWVAQRFSAAIQAGCAARL